jgi:cell division protein FtsB
VQSFQVRRREVVLSLALVASGAGCGMVPKQRLDDSQKLITSLRTENSQLKDASLSLRTQNQDLSQRAVEDARKISALDEAKSRLERSVQAYIDEREDLNTAFQQFKREAVAQIQRDESRSR